MSEATYTLVHPAASGATEDLGGVLIGSALEGETGLTTVAEDHCAEGKVRLLFRYRNKPRLEAVLCTLTDQLSELEVAARDVWVGRQLDTAVGVQLDGIGDIVGEPRKGRTDEVYRIFLRVRILVNRSDGKVEQLYAILVQAFGAVPMAITEHYPASLQVVLYEAIGDVLPGDFVMYLRQAKGGGVRLEFSYTVEALTDTLIWNSSESDQAWGSTADPDLGGVWAGVM